MLYALLKSVLRPALRVFFEQTDVAGRSHLPESGPLLVVANHPNTLLDPLLVGMLWRRQLHFLTSSRFFTAFGGWVLRACGAIPLFRQEDHTATAESPARLTGVQRAAHNDDSFRAAFGVLAGGGALLIFPEGSSVLTQHLRPLKLGAARIALGAEARHGWQLGVQLVPVGLTYAAAARFRSRLFRRVGAPIAVAAYRAQYEANAPAAIRALTADLRRALERQLPGPQNPAETHLLATLAPFLPDPHLGAALGPANAGEPTARHEFALGRTLLHALRTLATRDPTRAAALRQELLTYHEARQRVGLAAAVPLQVAPPPVWLRQCLNLVLGAPVWAWGWLHHAPALALPALLARRLTGEVEFVAAAKLMTGMLGLPFFYAGQTWLVGHYTHSAALALVYLLSLPLGAWGALVYQPHLAAWHGQWRVRRLAARPQPALADLRAQHATLRAALAQVAAEQAAPADA